MLGDSNTNTLRGNSHKNSSGKRRPANRRTSVNIKDRLNDRQNSEFNRDAQNELDISKKQNSTKKNLFKSTQDGIQYFKPHNLNQNTVDIKSQVVSTSMSKSKHTCADSNFFAQIYASRMIANQTDMSNNQKSSALCMDDLQKSFNLNIEQSGKPSISPPGRRQSIKPSIDQQVCD